jgi:hypothetical protein
MGFKIRAMEKKNISFRGTWFGLEDHKLNRDLA